MKENWNLAQKKRKVDAYRREKVNDPAHAHILSGILKCSCCSKSLYGNTAKTHSKDKKIRHYCKNTVTPTGHECTFRLNIEQTEMKRMVASIMFAMVSDPRFADAIKAKIGSAVDTNDLEKQPDDNWIRKIIFNFHVTVNGTEVKELPLENETMVETVVKLTLKKDTPKIEVTMEPNANISSCKPKARVT